MAFADTDAADRFVVICRACDRDFRAREQWVGREVQCPHCGGTMRVPERTVDGTAPRAVAPKVGAKRRFNFPCPRCKSLLESHTGMSEQTGHCPTCGARFVIPLLDPGSGSPRRADLLDEGGQDPVPMHAYAASGEQAPTLRRQEDGTYSIECPRCGALSDVSEDNCVQCGVPFSTEGVPTMTGQAARSLGTASLVLGIIALLLGVAATPWVVLMVGGPLAVLFGMMSWFKTGRDRPSVPAMIGIVLGVLALVGAIVRVVLEI
jgi:DNA-directed RNA polymerase subunit RPC12/RpoP